MVTRKRYFTNIIAYSYYPSSSTWIKNIKQKWPFEYLENPFTYKDLKNKLSSIESKMNEIKKNNKNNFKNKIKSNKIKKNKVNKVKYRSLSLPDLYRPIPTDSMKWSETILIDLSEKFKNINKNNLFDLGNNDENKLPKIK